MALAKRICLSFCAEVLLLVTLTFDNNAVAKEGFYLPFQLTVQEQPVQFQRILAATVLLQRGPDFNPNSHRCTGVFISETGHLLTALHCILGNLRGTSWLREGTYKSVARFDVIEQLPNAFLPVPESRMRYILPELGITSDLKVVFLGMGVAASNAVIAKSITPDKGPVDPITHEALDEKQIEILSTYQDDFTILQVDLGDNKAPCLTLEQDSPSKPEQLWTLGFPKSAQRNGDHSSDGIRKYITLGEGLTDFGKAPWVRQAQFSETAISILNRIFPQSVRVLGTMDGTQGMSGGPIVNHNGNLVGITTVGLAGADSSSYYLNGGLLGVRASHIKKEAERVLGATSAASLFVCNKM
jgi:hypothetical protein